MQKKVIEFNQVQRAKQMPEFNAGDVVKVHRKIKEGDKERIQIFEGLVIAVKGGQSSSPTITVRKVSNGVGVDLIIPVYSPNSEKVEQVKTAKVRRAKLYYLRGLTAKKSRMKYTDVASIVPEEGVAEVPAAEEAVAAEDEPATVAAEEVKAEEKEEVKTEKAE
ncbi:MAG: 50S ribosomal protein L19 [Candidatus Moranbacteria bacterium]|nr:50S ribosomal protein L19 [Candidatus Moranbacteria bacterium]